MNVLNETVSERFAMYQGDCVQTLEGLPENGVHYALFSPPFASNGGQGATSGIKKQVV